MKTTVAATQVKEIGMYQITITLGENTATAKLKNSLTVRDFIAQLPLTLQLDDYAATEKIANLPHTLSKKDAPAGIDPEIGDIAYYAPWGNIAIYYRNFGYSSGLIKLGEVTSGLEYFHFNGARQARFELVMLNKPLPQRTFT